MRTQDFSDFELNPVFFITNFYYQLYCQCSIISELVINIIGVFGEFWRVIGEFRDFGKIGLYYR